MLKNLFKLFVLLMVASMFLAACGTPATEAPAATKAPAAPAATDAPAATAVPPAEAPAAGKQVLKIWHYEAADSAMGQSWDDAMKDFKTAHPDVEIQFELKTFDQIQQTAQMVLNSADAPDVLEINKGNATAGLYAKQGLLTDLTDVAAKRGWDKILPSSIQTTCRYDANGIMGSGPLYGVTTYGEYVMVYYNKDLFKKHDVAVPTTFEEFEAAADKFLAAGSLPSLWATWTNGLPPRTSMNWLFTRPTANSSTAMSFSRMMSTSRVRNSPSLLKNSRNRLKRVITGPAPMAPAKATPMLPLSRGNIR